MISQESSGLFYDLMQSPLFKTAMDELIADQKEGILGYLRSCVSAGDLGAARQAEGSLQAIEDIYGVMMQYATKYAERDT